MGSDAVEPVVGFVRVLGLSDCLPRCCAPERNGSEAAESHRVGFPRNAILFGRAVRPPHPLYPSIGLCIRTPS